MKQTKLIISTVVVLMTAAPGAKAVVCMPDAYTAPTSCTGYTQAYAANAGDVVPMTGSWAVWGCTGGSGVKRFAGISYCSDTKDGKSQNQQGDPGNTKGKYCWCMLTNPAASAWVFLLDGDGSADACSRHCAAACADHALDESVFRSALFNAIDQ